MRWRSSSSCWKNLSCEGNAAIYKADQNRPAIASTIWKFPLQPSKQVPVSEQPCLRILSCETILITSCHLVKIKCISRAQRLKASYPFLRAIRAGSRPSWPCLLREKKEHHGGRKGCQGQCSF